MKTLQTLTTALLIAFSSFAFADGPDASKLKMDYALNAYINALSSGSIKGLAEVLDKDVKYTISRGEGIVTLNRSQILELFKSYENIEQNCTTTQSIIEAGDNQTIVKINMKYEAFSKVNFVTLNNTPKGWKITNISTTYN